MAGRDQMTVRTGKTYQLAEFMNANWDLMVGRTNEDVAQELGYRAANMISMWRTGKTRVSLEKLPEIARLMKVDIAALLPLWFEQYWGERTDGKSLVTTVFNRIASHREASLLSALRALPNHIDEEYTADQTRAIAILVMDKAVCHAVLEASTRQGGITPLLPPP